MSEPVVPSSDSELRAHVERVLSAHYELDTEIGRGGMGVVYRAKDRRLKRIVAIKVLPPELAFRSEIKTRFLREAETAAQLNHPNIVDIYAVDEAEGIVYFVMAYINGETLAERIAARGPLTPHHAGRMLREVAWADDGTVEALEDPDKRFAVGVLWHPEAGADQALFDRLVEEARRQQ